MEKQIKRDKYTIYLDAFMKTIRNYEEKMKTDDVSLYLKRAVYYGVKIINLKDKPKTLTPEVAGENFQITSVIKSLIGLLTPGEFENIFPIKKTYDGKKWQSKDYFYTRRYLDTLDPEEIIGEEKVLSFLWEYCNTEVALFNVKLMYYMSDLRRMEGYPSIAEEWANENGIESFEIQEDNKGNQFITKDGKPIKIRKPRPSHLRLVK